MLSTSDGFLHSSSNCHKLKKISLHKGRQMVWPVYITAMAQRITQHTSLWNPDGCPFQKPFSAHLWSRSYPVKGKSQYGQIVLTACMLRTVHTYVCQLPTSSFTPHATHHQLLALWLKQIACDTVCAMLQMRCKLWWVLGRVHTHCTPLTTCTPTYL